uniref:DnaD domain protein n=1 Tax=Coprococcus sp. TaxID=2049024 RepID=UPI003FF1207B
VAGIADHFNLTEKDICRAIRYWISEDVLRLEYDASGHLTGITLLPLHEKDKKTDDASLSLDSISLLKFPEKKAVTPTAPPFSEPVHTAVTVPNANVVQKPTSEFPEKQPYSAALAAKAKADDAFADVIFEAETYFRKELSVNDIEILIYIHDQLGFSTEVMEYLIEYCVSIDKLDLRYAEGIAKNWYKAGIHTLDEAKEAAENGTPLYRAVFKALGINRKAPTTGEIAWMDSWNKEMGFDLPIIIEACNRGIAQRPNDVTFAYVNGILKRWKKQGVKSIDDIEKASNQFHEDKKKSSQKANQYTVKPNAFNSFQQKDMSSALDEMEQLFLDEINSR